MAVVSETRSHIGRTIYISAALPETNDAAGFGALDFTKVNGLVQLPQLGVTHSAVEIPDLESGFGKAVKGMGTGMDTQAAFRMVPDDPGQALLKAQSDGPQGALAIKIVRGTGADNAPVSGDPVQYAHGFVHSYQENQGTGDNYEGFTVNFRQNDPTVNATE